MLKSNLIEIIKSFTKQEIAEFSDFLWSPYFNKKTSVIRLFDEIIKFSPDFTSEKLEKLKLWSKLYPGKEFNYGVMKNHIHDLTKLAEEYITQVEYRKNEVQEFSNLFKAVTNRNLRNVFENKVKYFNKIASDIFIKNIDITIEEYFHQLTKLYEIKTWNSHFYELKSNSIADRLAMEDNFIVGMLSHLISVNYTTETFSIDVKGKTNINNPALLLLKSIPEEIINTILISLKSRSEIKYILLNCYYLCYKASSDLTNPVSYLMLKEFFHNNFDLLPALTIRDIDVVMLNTLSLMSDILIDKEKEYFDIYLFKNDNNLILDKNKQINSLQFLPWSVIFFEQNKPAELKEFINKYSKFLIDDQKQSTLFAVEAVYCLIIKDFEKAQKLLAKTQFNIFPLKNFVKKLTLLINYELNDYESFLTNIDSLNHFLNYSEKEAKVERKTNIKRTRLLMSYLNKLFLIKESFQKEDMSILESKIQNDYIDFKKWFFRKIEELKSI